MVIHKRKGKTYRPTPDNFKGVRPVRFFRCDVPGTILPQPGLALSSARSTSIYISKAIGSSMPLKGFFREIAADYCGKQVLRIMSVDCCREYTCCSPPVSVQCSGSDIFKICKKAVLLPCRS
jgi:hypothetical protein